MGTISALRNYWEWNLSTPLTLISSPLLVVLLPLLANEPPFGIPPILWPALALAVGVGVLFTREIIVPGTRLQRAEKRIAELELALYESATTLKATHEYLAKLAERKR